MDKVAEITKEQEAAYQELQELFGGLDDADWGRSVYGHSEGWTVRDLLSHLVTAGSGLLGVAQLIAEGRLEMPSDFDLDRWNRRQVEKQAERTVPELLESLGEVQRNVLAYLDVLTAHDGATILSRHGHHAVFGESTVELILRRIYQHDREHAAQIRQALGDG